MCVCLFVCFYVCDTTVQIPVCCLQLQKYLTSQIHEVEADNAPLRYQIDEFKMKLQQSDSISSDLKRQLQEQEELVKSSKDRQKQLQTTVDELTKTVGALNQRLQVLCEPPKFVSTFNIPGSLKYHRVSGRSNWGHTATLQRTVLLLSSGSLLRDNLTTLYVYKPTRFTKFL